MDLIEPLLLTWLFVVYNDGSMDPHLLRAQQNSKPAYNVVAGEIDGGGPSLCVVERPGAGRSEVAQAAQLQERISVKA